MPKNVLPSTTWKIGDDLKYDCDANYEISGENPITCLSSGHWSSDAPECVGKLLLENNFSDMSLIIFYK